MRDFTTVANEYIQARIDRRAVAAARLRLGIAHARANHVCVGLEVELLECFPQQTVYTADGTKLQVGNKNSDLRDRVRITDPVGLEVVSTHCLCGRETPCPVHHRS
jgi:hypothetical protein